MKHINIILLCITTCIGAIAFFFICQHTYRYKKSVIKQKARQAFVEAFDQELKSRNVNGSFMFSYDAKNIVSVDIPDSVYLENESGKHWYRIDPEKHRMNITNNSNVRSLHSCVFSRNPIDPDSLKSIWKEYLQKSGISNESALYISVIDAKNKVKLKKTFQSEWCNDSNLFLDVYIGYACEFEIRGYLRYSLWGMMCMEILLYLVLGIVLVYGCYRVCITVSDKIQSMFQKEIIEVPVIKLVQGVSDIPVRSYILNENVLFYAEQRIIEIEGIKKKMPLQACLLLELFLKSKDYIATDTEIMNTLWTDGSGHLKRVHKAVTRLRIFLMTDLPVRIERENFNTYQLII